MAKGKNNNKKNNVNSKRLKLILLSVIGVIVLAGLVTTVISVVNKKNIEKTVRVAFYGLSEEYCNLIKDFIPVEDKVSVKYDMLSEGSLDLGAIKEKYDMLFTWKGEVTDALEASSEEVPAKILDCMPSSLRNKKCVPILLDHYELAYSKTVIEKTGKEIPTSYPGFLNYLNQAKSYVFSPFFFNGADDRTLTAFIGAVVQAIGGQEAYDILVSELKNNTPFDALLDVNLGMPNFSLRTAIDPLTLWGKEGYTHPAWFNAQGNDLLYFAEAGQIGVFFTTLQEHRQIPYNIISNYEAFILPPASSTIKYGIIAPAISGMLISDNANAKRYLAELFTETAQETLSDRTRLAPIHARVQAYDRQADDVRYWAASCPAGALPDIALAAFQRDPEGLKAFALELRNYIK